MGSKSSEFDAMAENGLPNGNSGFSQPVSQLHKSIEFIILSFPPAVPSLIEPLAEQYHFAAVVACVFKLRYQSVVCARVTK